MFNNTWRDFNLLSIILLVLGAILGYGSKFILGKLFKSPKDIAVLLAKLLGLIMVVSALILIFTG